MTDDVINNVITLGCYALVCYAVGFLFCSLVCYVIGFLFGKRK